MSQFFRNLTFALLIVALAIASNAQPIQARKQNPNELLQTSSIQPAMFLAVSRQGGSSDNQIYRYSVAGPDSPITPDLVFTRPNITNPYGLAFNASGELYISNAYISPSIARLTDPFGSLTENGSVTNNNFVDPVGIVIRDETLYVAQVNGPVLIFSLDSNGGGTLLATISNNLQQGSTRNVAINPQGNELFVSQCCGGDSIVRFTINSPGNVTFRGVINGNGLGGAHDLLFSPWGELFVANAGNSISRFVFDQSGNAIPNGQITGNGLAGPLGIDFSPWGELFAASHFDAKISRWTFADDTSKTAIPNGFVSAPNTMADLMFLPSNNTTYNFSGFFQPVDNLPTLNLVKAGQAVPVKFSLDGNQGLEIFEIGYPKSQAIPCDSTALVDGIEETSSSGASGLSYNSDTDQYTYIWKTSKTWARTCRQLIIKLVDGTYQRANFKFN